MPYLPNAQEWLTHSARLLEARPTTTRITTKYTLIPPSAKSTSKSSKSAKVESSAASTDPSATSAPDAPVTVAPPPTTRASLTLKTYDPVSGVTLKYETDKQAEVGRLISSLARLGRSMAGLPELKEDTAMVDAQTLESGETASGVATPVAGGGAAPQGTSGGQGGQLGKKGKKKGRK